MKDLLKSLKRKKAQKFKKEMVPKAQETEETLTRESISLKINKLKT
jgi:hypothetical protein